MLFFFCFEMSPQYMGYAVRRGFDTLILEQTRIETGLRQTSFRVSGEVVYLQLFSPTWICSCRTTFSFCDVQQQRHVSIVSQFAYGWLRTESGIHRLVRISPFDIAARRHTSFASVSVYPIIIKDLNIDGTSPRTFEGFIRFLPSHHAELLKVSLLFDSSQAIWILSRQILTLRRFVPAELVASMSTKPILRCALLIALLVHEESIWSSSVLHYIISMYCIGTGIVVQCQNERSQVRNKATALQMLHSRLALAEENRQAKIHTALRSTLGKNSFGAQIRSYVLNPYTVCQD